MLPGVAVHVIHRGNNRAECFFRNEDRSFYLFHLNRLLPRVDCRLHAYCLMSNHLHLLLTAETTTGCGLLMKAIAQLHAQYINKNYARSGYLWESRFKSCLVESEDYVLACYRYIELNPVRAGMVSRPSEYPWSSYAANAMGHASLLIAPHEEYLALGRDPHERQAVYRDLFGSLLGAERVAEIRSATNGGYVLGSPGFKRAVARVVGRAVEKGSAGRPVRERKPEDQPDLL
jgi:REP-associated tyrosine transposase